MKKIKPKEKDMFIPVKKLLEKEGCSQVYGEIYDFDVVGVQGYVKFIVEMKTTLNFKVIEQAIRAKSYGHYVYIAVPKPSFRNDSHFFAYSEILSRHKIGIIHVDLEKFYLGVDKKSEEFVATIYQRAKFNNLATKHNQYLKKYDRKNPIDIEMESVFAKDNIGGVKGGEAITSYSYMIDLVKTYLKENGETSVDELIDNIPHITEHYKNPKQSLYGTLRQKWNEHWVDVNSSVGEYKGKKVWLCRYKGEDKNENKKI